MKDAPSHTHDICRPKIRTQTFKSTINFPLFYNIQGSIGSYYDLHIVQSDTRFFSINSDGMRRVIFLGAKIFETGRPWAYFLFLN